MQKPWTGKTLVETTAHPTLDVNFLLLNYDIATQLLIFYGIHKCDLVPKTTISRRKHEFAVEICFFYPLNWQQMKNETCIQNKNNHFLHNTRVFRIFV